MKSHARYKVSISFRHCPEEIEQLKAKRIIRLLKKNKEEKMDVRIKAGFTNHLKTRRLLKKTGPEGVYGLISLWSYAAENKKDGDLSGIPYEELAEIACWRLDPTFFVESLVSVGFLDRTEKALTIHDWHEHQNMTTTHEKKEEKKDKTKKAKKPKITLVDEMPTEEVNESF